MPRGDGTGPMGGGPMSGRAAGYCAGYGVPGYANQAVGGRGFGLGRGFGRGFGRGRAYGAYPASAPVPAYDPAREKEYLEQELVSVENEMKALRDRISELENSEN